MIDFSNPAVLVHGGAAIPIDTQAEYDAALNAAKQIYEGRPGGRFDSDALGDLENRIRGGMDLNAIISATYDDANRRFPANAAADVLTRDAQTQAGPQFTPTAGEVQQIITSAGISPVTAQAAAVPSRQLADIIGGTRTLSTQQVRPMSAGPMQAGMFSMPGTAGGGGLSVGMVLMLGGAGLALFFLLKGKKGKRS